MLLTTPESLIQSLINFEMGLSDLKGFTKLCYEMENAGLISVQKIHKYVPGAWFNYCWFQWKNFQNTKEEAFFLLSQDCFLAIGKLSAEDFKLREKEITSGQLHTFVTSLTYLDFERLPPLNEKNLKLLSGALLNQKIDESTRETIQKGRLISPYIWEWNPEKIGHLLFNWWDD
jgi:hypothetical protein